MKRLIMLPALFLLCITAVAQSSDNSAATKEDIQRYMDVMHTRDLMTQTMGAMTQSMHKMVHDQYLKDKDKLPADFEEQTNRMMDDMFKNMPFEEMLQAMMPVYQRHFTKGDGNALVAFYSSPTGQKMLHELPAIMTESMEAMMPLMEKYMETVKQRVNDEFAKALNGSEKKTN